MRKEHAKHVVLLVVTILVHEKDKRHRHITLYFELMQFIILNNKCRFKF